MTDAFLAHVRFSDHTARCDLCAATDLLCETAVQLLAAWHQAEQLATKQAEETDRAMADATGNDADLDCVEDISYFREAQRESFE